MMKDARTLEWELPKKNFVLSLFVLVMLIKKEFLVMFIFRDYMKTMLIPNPFPSFPYRKKITTATKRLSPRTPITSLMRAYHIHPLHLVSYD